MFFNGSGQDSKIIGSTPRRSKVSAEYKSHKRVCKRNKRDFENKSFFFPLYVPNSSIFSPLSSHSFLLFLGIFDLLCRVGLNEFFSLPIFMCWFCTNRNRSVKRSGTWRS